MPFDFFDTCRYFKNFSAEDQALLYGITGGTLNIYCKAKNTPPATLQSCGGQGTKKGRISISTLFLKSIDTFLSMTIFPFLIHFG